MSSTGNRPPRQLSINRHDLEAAFEGFPAGTEYYLDLETGKIVWITDDARAELDSILSELPDSASGEIALEAIEAALEEGNTADWLGEMVLDAAQVEADTKGQFIEIPNADSHENFMLMESFIETVSDPRFQNRLRMAIRERRPFRRFKDALKFNEVEEERWFAFERAEIHKRMQEWLEAEGIQATFVEGV